VSNLKIYDAVRSVPGLALKPIQGGRLKGMTDINPMWRIKALTEQFGPCGIGWKYEITEKRLEKGAEDTIAAFVDINLYISKGESSHATIWSEAIPGTGGSMFVAKERGGMYTSDECFKMALTDSISVACKALGFGADVYWEKDNTKYSNQKDGIKQNLSDKPPTPQPADEGKPVVSCKDCGNKITPKVANYSIKQYGRPLCMDCQKKAG